MVDAEEEYVFRVFADAHPHEAHAADPERFWAYFSERCPGVSREEMEGLLAGVEASGLKPSQLSE